MNFIRIRNLTDKKLMELSKKRILSLDLKEMKAIKNYFIKQRRDPTLMELEIIAQTWSEHCKHKTMTGIIEYRKKVEGNEWKVEVINNLLKETIFKATRELKKKYCLSVFADNAGIIEWNKDYAVTVKVETHNHPSAVEPYGGASTGIGGVIRDILGSGLGAKPVANIDVFCVGPLNSQNKDVPEEIFEPKKLLKGIVSGVRDYGNRVGIPTGSGTVISDEKYLFNPLVYCGTVGVIPKKFIKKKPRTGDLIVSVGGKTGRDGIHGATFSSIALDSSTDSSCVQIGDPITEKKFIDVLLKARDKGFYNSITDCGAGGFSSAIGEMAKELGAIVYLDEVPLKYKGLKGWEIFLSESQERMVLSVPKEKFKLLKKLLEDEDVEVTLLGRFTGDKKLRVFYRGRKEADIDMIFLHEGMPKRKLKAVWIEPEIEKEEKILIKNKKIFEKVLRHPSVSSKENIVRQYDHEVQGGVSLKPYEGNFQDIPQDGFVIRPLLKSFKGIAVGLGINPFYTELDPFSMALSCCEEAVRNVISIGGDIEGAAFLDNFCWGNVKDEKILGSLVESSRGCYKAGKMLKIPFVSGKDSLNNFYIYRNREFNIPGTLLISCVSRVKDVRKIKGVGFKRQGSFIYLIGDTYNELGGSIFNKVRGRKAGIVPTLREMSYKILKRVSSLTKKDMVFSMHDLSEGGLFVSLVEMSFSGKGAEIDLNRIRLKDGGDKFVKLFSESNSRFLLEIDKKKEKEFLKFTGNIPCFKIGKVLKSENIVIKERKKIIYREEISYLKSLCKKAFK